jgi:antitoxin component YwqK of YwqJK toxin-antitoxin module
MSIIGYYKDYRYVVTIRANDYTSVSKTVINSETALYKTQNYEILKIEDIIENEIEDPTFRVKKLLFFYISKELALFDKFIEYEEYNIFNLGYSGMYREYHENGSLYREFYHINGKIHGEYLSFYSNGNPQVICDYVNGEKFGRNYEYTINGVLYFP